MIVVIKTNLEDITVTHEISQYEVKERLDNLFYKGALHIRKVIIPGWDVVNNIKEISFIAGCDVTKTYIDLEKESDVDQIEKAPEVFYPPQLRRKIDETVKLQRGTCKFLMGINYTILKIWPTEGRSLDTGMVKGYTRY